MNEYLWDNGFKLNVDDVAIAELNDLWDSNWKAKEELIYPIFKKSIAEGTLVRFTNTYEGVVVKKGENPTVCVGTSSKDLLPHTDLEIWEDVPYDTERCLYHGQPVICWDAIKVTERIYRFYDAVNKCSFTGEGIQNGRRFIDYEAIPHNQVPEWMVEAYEKLEV